MIDDYMLGGYNWRVIDAEKGGPVTECRSTGDRSGDWARELLPVTRSRAEARLAYDRASRWSRFEEPFERRAQAVGLDLLRVQPGERVLELGCGAGGALIALARAVGPAGRVVGIDLSPGMIRQAAARLPRARLSERAELLVGDAGSIPFTDASFDAVFMSFTLELFDTPEIPLVLAECRRVVRPGGRIGVVSLSRADPVRWPTRLYEWLHDRFPATLDCRPIHARLALEAAGFVQARSRTIPLWGLRAEAVVAVRPSTSRAPSDDATGSQADVSEGRQAGPKRARRPSDAS
jgi:demethylmenaquinone methyltransferase/2-methoxy-6-polyprenyl-1,4-benzoquinol methylase